MSRTSRDCSPVGSAFRHHAGHLSVASNGIAGFPSAARGQLSVGDRQTRRLSKQGGIGTDISFLQPQQKLCSRKDVIICRRGVRASGGGDVTRESVGEGRGGGGKARAIKPLARRRPNSGAVGPRAGGWIVHPLRLPRPRPAVRPGRPARAQDPAPCARPAGTLLHGSAGWSLRGGGVGGCLQFPEIGCPPCRLKPTPLAGTTFRDNGNGRDHAQPTRRLGRSPVRPRHLRSDRAPGSRPDTRCGIRVPPSPPPASRFTDGDSKRAVPGGL